MSKGTAGTAIKFNGEAGADVAWSLEGLANSAGRVSAQHDLGSGERDMMFMWHCEAVWQATPTQYGTLDLYLAGAYDGDSTMIWGDVGATDAALGDVDQLRNLQPLGSVIVEEADTTIMVAGGYLFWPHRYISLAAYNRGGAALNATDTNILFFLQPINIT